MYLTGTLATDVSTRAAFKTVTTQALLGQGWTLVGDFPEPDLSGSNASTYYRVFRSTAANSGQTRDIFLTFFASNLEDGSTADVTFYFLLSEDFNTATSQISVAPGTDFYSKTDAQGRNVIDPRRPRQFSTPPLVVATGGQYWISVNARRFIMSVRSSNSSVSNSAAGYLTNLLPTSIPNTTPCLWQGVLGGNGNQYGTSSFAWVREPGSQVTADNRQAFGGGFTLIPDTFYDPAYYGAYIGIRPYFSHCRQGVYVAGATMEGLITFGDRAQNGAGAFNVGDTVTTAETQYVCFRPTSRTEPNYFIDKNS